MPVVIIMTNIYICIWFATLDDHRATFCHICYVHSNETFTKWENIDIYIKPITNKLKKLWWPCVWVDNYSIASELTQRFRLKRCLIWWINNWSGYAIWNDIRGLCWLIGNEIKSPAQPTRLETTEILEQTVEYKFWLAIGNVAGSKLNPSR